MQANSGDPDHDARYTVFDLDLYCSFMFHEKDAMPTCLRVNGAKSQNSYKESRSC